MAARPHRQAFRRPPQPSPPLDQAELFAGDAALPDPAEERRRQRQIDAKVAAVEATMRKNLEAIAVYRQLRERGVTMPDVAEALGLAPAIPRASRRLKPWRLRAGSNMDLIAIMLEDAGRRGVAEGEMVEHLRRCGRLGSATHPSRAVHWSVTELQRRTRFLTRERTANGARWYAYGRFDAWRQPATYSNGKIKTRSTGGELV